MSIVGKLHSWHDIVEWVLGQHPLCDIFRGSALKFKQLIDTFHEVPVSADELSIER